MTLSASMPEQASAAARRSPIVTTEAGQRLMRLTGFLFLVTYVSSIPPVLVHYAPALSDPAFILQGGYDVDLATGALLELVLIAANIGSALAL